MTLPAGSMRSATRSTRWRRWWRKTTTPPSRPWPGALRSDRLKLAAIESATADERRRDDGQAGDRVAPPGSSISASRPVSGHDGPASRADRAPAPVDLLDRLV